MTSSNEEEFEREVKRLRLLIEQTNAGLLAFGLYSNVQVRDDAIERLRSAISLRIIDVQISETSGNPLLFVESFPPVPRCCFLFTQVEEAFPKLLGYLNLQREQLLKSGHALVFWVREEGMRRIGEEAPDFWAWRSGVFDFRIPERPTILEPNTGHDATISFYTPSQIRAQIHALEEHGDSDLGNAIALGRRLLTEGSLERAETILSGALDRARNARDLRAIAEALLLLGNAKFQQRDLDAAETLYRESLDTARALNSRDQIFAATRQISAVQQAKGNLEGSYQAALMAMQIAERLGDAASLASAYDRIANVLGAKGDLRGAAQWLERAVEHERQLHFFSDLGHTLLQLALVYEKMGSHGLAVKSLNEAYLLVRDMGTKTDLAQLQEAAKRIGIELVP